MRQQFRKAPTYRSMLYIPGSRLDWMLKAGKYGADAYIYDLEDSVPIEEKSQARRHVASALEQLRNEPFGRFVRVNGWHEGHTLQDVMAVVQPGLDGILLAKTEDVEDVQGLDLVLEELEIARGLERGRIEIIPVCETARGMYRHYDICMASERIRRSGGGGGSARGDATRALGIKPISDDGSESLTVNGRAGLEARAAGVTQITGGMTLNIDDLDLVRRLALRAKSLGATGSSSIHPSHVPIHNEVFSPSEAELTEAKEVLEAMAAAVKDGRAAARLHGEMIDYAHVRTALELLESAQAMGLFNEPIPEIPVTSYEGALGH